MRPTTSLQRAVLTDIANEERVHVGELLRLLSILTGDEDDYYKKGTLEVDTLAGTARRCQCTGGKRGIDHWITQNL